jgi:hypothetical protein
MLGAAGELGPFIPKIGAEMAFRARSTAALSQIMLNALRFKMDSGTATPS